MLPLDLKLCWSASLSLWLDDRGGVLWVGPLKSCRILHITPNPQGMQHEKRSAFLLSLAAQHNGVLFITFAICNLIYTTRVAYRQKISHGLRKIRNPLSRSVSKCFFRFMVPWKSLAIYEILSHVQILTFSLKFPSSCHLIYHCKCD